MRSNLHLLWTGLLVLSLSGCDFLRRSEKEKDVLEISDSRFQCLQTLPDTMKNFFAGRGQATPIRRDMDCLSEAFTFFRQRTRGTFEDAYTAEDLRKFFGKYFLKENNISPELADNLMRLKKAILGGAGDRVTKVEIDRLIKLLGNVKEEAVQLAPQMGILLNDEVKGTNSVNAIDKAIKQLRRSTLHLFREIDLSRSDYTFQDGQKLVLGFADFIRGSSPVRIKALDIQEWWPFIEQGKVLLFGQRASLSNLGEWQDAIDLIVDAYGGFLRYKFLVQGKDFDNPDDLRSALDLVESVLGLLERSPQMRLHGRIAFVSIDDLLKLALEKKLLPWDVSLEAFKELYRQILVGLFDPVRRGDLRTADALERLHLVSLRRELAVFRFHQDVIDQLSSAGGPGILKSDLPKALAGIGIEEVLRRRTSDSIEQRLVRSAWEKFQNLLLKPWPMMYTANERVLVSAGAAQTPRTWRSFSRFNIMHSLTRIFMQGYGDTGDPIRSFVTETSLKKWYADFDRFGVESKAFDPRSKNAGSRSFKEASFFTFSGDGDDRLNMDEMFDFISVLFTAGLTNVDDIRHHMHQGGCEIDRADIFGEPWLKEDCFRQQLRWNFAGVFGGLPGMAEAVRQMNDSQWTAFADDLLGAARISDPQGGLVENGDVRTMVMILHYVETLMVIFDTDGSGTLSPAEVRAGTPRFLSFLRPLSPSQNEEFLQEAFVAMVFKGAKPGGWDMTKTEWRRFKEWIGLTDPPQAGRAQLMKVFRSLKAELSAPTAPKSSP